MECENKIIFKSINTYLYNPPGKYSFKSIFFFFELLSVLPAIGKISHDHIYLDRQNTCLSFSKAVPYLYSVCV